MGKKVLLINPNQYHHPPVIPIGLEYLSHALTVAGHKTRLLDLSFEDNLDVLLSNEIKSYNPDVIGISIRNIDSVLYPDTEYFLPAIKKIISSIRIVTDSPVIVGGAGMGVDPEGVINFTGSDAGVLGAGEKAFLDVLECLDTIKGSGKIFMMNPPDDLVYSRGNGKCWNRYIEGGGLGGFITHYGCSSACPYCIEAKTPVTLKNPESIVSEVLNLYESGFTYLHLCDPEFNENLPHSLKTLKAIINKAPQLKWALYMRPGYYSAELFELLSSSGANLITLSVDTCTQRSDYFNDVSELIRLAGENGIKICIDLLAGFPDETEGLLPETMQLLERAGADDIVVNTTLRLYKTLPITKVISSSKKHLEHVIGNHNAFSSDMSGLLEPVFYQRIKPEDVRAMAGGSAKVRIAGDEKVVNYEANS